MLDFEFSVQAALGLLYLSANVLIIHAASEKISQVNVVYHCGKDDQGLCPLETRKPFGKKA